ncbi:hypothetical protein LSCM1_00554 [Leishmania martiniquensis]|uniref:MRH domain-containing protein n=1 Tax=Leishmania martiniquensis TaxID=1580590 RepID=A0A836FYW3_9TRYP|nr:hypothetical protein LSCM1_00554 [Leishmania martiniquensis]
MMGWRSGFALWLATVAFAVVAFEWRSAAAAPMDLTSPVEHRHFLQLAAYDGRHSPSNSAAEATAARYVQLSNGSRFVCETTNLRRREPLDVKHYPLEHHMASLMIAMRNSDQPCVQYAAGKHVIVYCWDRKVREEYLTEGKGRFLGRRTAERTQRYWIATDALGRYAATVYGDGEECPYDKVRRIETEVRLYCRQSEFQNPIPYLSLYESSQCRYILRLLSDKFCSVPQLDHPREEETVRCQMLDDQHATDVRGGL